MKLSIRKAPEPSISRKDTIVFVDGTHRVEVAHGRVGCFDSTPYEPRQDSWSYDAELHAHAGRLWICRTNYEEVITLGDGDWVRKEEQERALYVSDNDGKTWQAASEEPPLGDATRLDRVESWA